MSAIRSPLHRFAAWVQACGLLFILMGMALALGASAWNFFARAMSDPAAVKILTGAGTYLLLAGAGLAGLRWMYRRHGSRAFLLTVLGASMLIQTGVILASDKNWEWSVDARAFNHYLERLSDHGYTPETLGELSKNYDYPVWTHRAQPFYYILRLWTGDRFVRAVQFFQAVLIVLALGLTWRIAKILFGQAVAFWAASLQFLMPYQWLACLDLNHHIPGVLYFSFSLWILAEWSRNNRGRCRPWVLALCAGVAVPLMRFEGGADRIYVAAVALALVLLQVGGRQNTRQTVQSAAALLAWPLFTSALLVAPLSARIDQSNLHRLSSGTVAFMARGWMPETGGEYSATYEQIDCLTPLGKKQSALASLLASQAFYNPRTLLFRLFPVKLTKYFLLGHATGTEEMLVQNGATTAAWLAKGARTAYLLAALPLMIWGGFLLLPLVRTTPRILLVLPGALFCLATVLVGETSPRYSTYIHPLLFMLGALPLAWGAWRRGLLLRASRAPGLLAAGSLGAAFLVAAGLLFAARPWFRHRACQDMRGWTPAPGALVAAVPATLAPMEIHLLPHAMDSGTEWSALDLPAAPDLPGTLCFYALPSGAPAYLLQGHTLVTAYATPGGIRTQTNALPARICLEYTPSAPGTLTMRTPTALPFPLCIGYAAYETKAP